MTKGNPDNLYDQQFDDAADGAAAEDAAATDYGDAYYDDAYEGAYDDEIGGENAAAAGAAGAGAGAAAAGTGGGGGAHAKKGGLPLRGLAMVLIAVAVMLGLWGLYAMTSEDDDSTVASDSEQSKSDGSANGGQEGNGAGGPAADGARGDGSRDGANNQPPREGEGDNAHPNGGAEGEANRDADARDPHEEGRAGDEARAGGNDAPSAARDRNDIKVSVLNNSGESDKAKNEADVLKDGGFKVGYVGNLPGDVLTVPKTTVFYPEGDTSAESLAKEVAARYQAEIKPMNKDLPKEATDDGAVVVALAVPQA
ncbi:MULTISPECIES: LytR C-terminal domain-containing protein [Corynebacterium]|uniref:LytR C-terminal domain-containing protein n=1 Tax=Corynebacterium TaxID=1716 RepID=UPI001EF52F1F|nr:MULTISPECIES: LytR C-terminal domain-containing protein [Corynebacterium]MCG7233471.1 LytR C-terminal domain-containing protein [Corynebacterium sp. ACRPR]MCG7242599.1 LytR C-terminal domain-containing protein [Corynebacterium sp. ACRPS]MCG7270992.1 LytR C-terminal domain-containing protein [Corynebacterium sp. ACRQM]MDK8473245.1 LytR C-terminal domain-containing protein [Corynebacterium sp. MSK078]MDK8658827.1 LytR C-terminal domain-containing protein [Corynebacterium sp. MSK204]